MKKLTLIVCFFLFSLIANVTAQNNIKVSIGGGYISSLIDNTKLPYWESGYTINISSDYAYSQNVSFFISTSYQKHFFNEKLLSIVVPAVIGYNYSVDGENSSLFEFSIGSKFYTNYTSIRPYLGVGAGLLLINQGKVEFISWMEGSSHKSSSIYADTDKNYNLFQVNFGLGLEIEFIDNLQIVFDGRFVNTIEGPSYFPLTASIKIGI